MAVREHEAIAIGPDRILRIEAHDPIPQRVDQGASAMGVPGCPELACWTASIESVRMVLIDS